jgi:hypothetical protein
MHGSWMLESLEGTRGQNWTSPSKEDSSAEPLSRDDKTFLMLIVMVLVCIRGWVNTKA